MLPNVKVACVNLCPLSVWKVDFAALTHALQTYYDTAFLPTWGYPLTLYVAKDVKKIDPAHWQFLYMPDADDAGALGYHDLTKSGQPISKVFVKESLKSDPKNGVSMTASHELCEMAIDPLANIWAQAPDGRMYAYEMCDPVEEDGFFVAGYKMSNFVTPAWFEPFNHPKGIAFDYMRKLAKPFSMTKGGYMIIRDDKGEHEVFGSAEKKARFASEDRRGHRSEFRKPQGMHCPGTRDPEPTYTPTPMEFD